MPGNPREVARRALRQVLTAELHASGALDRELATAGLAARDVPLATELLYGTLRHLRRLDRALDTLASRGIAKLSPKILATLRVGAYQILLLDRVPDHAAVDDAVTAARQIGGARVAGFVNGVLRRLARDGEPALPDPDADRVDYFAVRDSLPHWVVRRMAKALGDELDAASAALAQPASLSVRANTTRVTREQLAQLLTAEVPRGHVTPSPLAPDALLVDGLGGPTASASFRDGLWTVQDVAAQLVAHLVAPTPGQRILDACAGVGGKSTHLLQLCSDGARVEAMDLSRRKLDTARQTAARLGLRNLRSQVADLTSAELESAAYDAVLLDAPCTGLGVLRRHPEAKWRIRSGDVSRMVALQAEMLATCAGAVKPGGVLVYSVCTFTREEGAQQIDAFLAAHDEFSCELPPPGPVPWERLAADGYVRTWPHRHDADGFFAARLVRRA